MNHQTISLLLIAFSCERWDLLCSHSASDISRVKISCFHAKACTYLFTSMFSLRGEGVKTTYAINIRVQMNEQYCCILNVYMNISRNPQWKKITIAKNAAWKEQFFGKLQLKLAREGSQHCLSTKITVTCQNSALLKHFQKSPKNPGDFLALSPSLLFYDPPHLWKFQINKFGLLLNWDPTPRDFLFLSVVGGGGN